MCHSLEPGPSPSLCGFILSRYFFYNLVEIEIPGASFWGFLIYFSTSWHMEFGDNTNWRDMLCDKPSWCFSLKGCAHYARLNIWDLIQCNSFAVIVTIIWFHHRGRREDVFVHLGIEISFPDLVLLKQGNHGSWRDYSQLLATVFNVKVKLVIGYWWVFSLTAKKV